MHPAYKSPEEKVLLFSEEIIKNPVESLIYYFDIREELEKVRIEKQKSHCSRWDKGHSRSRNI